MERESIKVRSGREYDHLFPRAMLTSVTKKKGATVADTIRFIPNVIRDTLFHTQKIAQVLKRDNVYDTCHAIWDFVYEHIAYQKDEAGKEQVRSPARTWHDRHNIQGVDCDCMTVFIASILCNLKVRRIALRITKYSEDRFQHIYPVVILPGGREIIIDCVTNQFDYEVPYTEKKDTYMDLEYLNGVEGPGTDATDLIGLYGGEDILSDLGRTKRKGKLKELLKKAFHFTNILNPGMVMLRAGILASAKLNIMKIGQRLKYSYLSDEEARKRGIDMNKFAKLKRVREKLEKIYYGVGGKPENLKKAVLKGHGNKNHDVSGLGHLGYMPDAMEGMNENTPLPELLGYELYGTELYEVSGLGELGEPATAASIATATTVIGAIAGLLKSIGSIFPKKDKASADFDVDKKPTVNVSSDDAASAGGSIVASAEKAVVENNSNSKQRLVKSPPENAARESADASPPAKESADSTTLPTTKADDTTTDKASEKDSSTKDNETKEDNTTKPNTQMGFWQKNKKWLLPTSIGLGVLVVSYTGYRLVKSNKAQQQTALPPATKAALAGFTKSRKKKKSRNKRSIQSRKHKQPIMLL
jgi:hypothetical protein